MLIIRIIQYPVTSTISVPQQSCSIQILSLIISYVPIPALILFMVRINVNVILMMNKLKQLRKKRDIGFTLNTNGTWNINKGWLKTLRYVLSGTYMDKDSYYETVYSSATSPYSMTTTNGAVLSNFAGQHIYDANGNQITNFGPEDINHYAVYLPSSYLGHYEIDSREVNLFAKVTSSLFKASGHVNNRILIGADFRSDGNVGKGKLMTQVLLLIVVNTVIIHLSVHVTIRIFLSLTNLVHMWKIISNGP